LSTPQTTEGPVVAPVPRGGTMLSGSLMRLASDASGVVLGLVSSIVTARVLGPSGKGTLAALTFVTLLVSQCATLGLGDAAVVRVGQAKASAQRALSSSLGLVLVTSLVGAALVFAYSIAQLPIGDGGIWAAVAVACLTVVIGGVGQLLIFLVYARQRVVAVSVLTIAMSATAAAAVVVLCVLIDLDVLGGVLAGLVAALVGFVAATVMLARDRLVLRPRFDRDYLRPALSFGLRAQLASLLAYSTARVDLLIVYAMASHHEAGIYSVALTLGTITGFVAIALSFASFPRMSAMPEERALALTAEMVRVAMILGTALAALLGLALSTLIAVLLGSDYSDSLVPGLVLLVANVVWGGQWLLSRALASRGDASLLIRSFALNLGTMVALDLVLVPLAGATGAAVATLLASIAGLALCLRAYRARGVPGRTFVPRRADVVRLAEVVRTVTRAVRTAVGR
jgi:O-antigen/teichoic acid export membrane protein